MPIKIVPRKTPLQHLQEAYQRAKREELEQFLADGLRLLESLPAPRKRRPKRTNLKRG